MALGPVKRVRRKRGSRCCAHCISHVGTEAQRGSGQLSRAGAHSSAPQPRPTGFSRVPTVLAAAGGRCLASCPALPADLTAFREWLSAAVGANRAASSSALHRLPARAAPPGWASERPPLPHQGLPDIRGCRSAQPHLGASGDGRPFWKFPSQSSSWAQAQTHRGPAVRPGTHQLSSLPLPPWWKAGRTDARVGGPGMTGWPSRQALTATLLCRLCRCCCQCGWVLFPGPGWALLLALSSGLVRSRLRGPVRSPLPVSVTSTVTVLLLRAGRALATGARADLASSCHLSLWGPRGHGAPLWARATLLWDGDRTFRLSGGTGWAGQRGDGGWQRVRCGGPLQARAGSHSPSWGVSGSGAHRRGSGLRLSRDLPEAQGAGGSAGPT